MRLWLIYSIVLANVVTSRWCGHVEAVACEEICYTTELTGFGPGGIPGCFCSGLDAGARTGIGECNCGQCYTMTQGTVYGFAINSDGTCTYGTDCGSCDFLSSPSTSTSSTPSIPPPSLSPTPSLPPSPTPTLSPSPTLLPAALEPSFTSDVNSSSAYSSSSSSSTATSSYTTNLNSTSDPTSIDSSSSISSDDIGNATGSHVGRNGSDTVHGTWQVILTICCSVLVFVVGVVSVCSCYCKARSRLNEHEEAQVSYYSQQMHAFEPRVTNLSTRIPATCTKSPASV
ncbi:unnamed protein product [Peronospora belbahrii]|uniref:Uncharacterized protein n=1 Tax=Peronospora belbahrii TaxID=622444 RepID=A0ABN8D2N9_9STRA|nr:unnamed protein product [Peronospora belbahrii]